MLLFVSLLLGLAAVDAKAAVQPSLMQASSSSSSIEVFIPKQAMLKDGEGEYLCTAWLLPDKPLRLVGVDVLADPQAVDEVTVMGEAARQQQQQQDVNQPPAGLTHMDLSMFTCTRPSNRLAMWPSVLTWRGARQLAVVMICSACCCCCCCCTQAARFRPSCPRKGSNSRSGHGTATHSPPAGPSQAHPYTLCECMPCCSCQHQSAAVHAPKHDLRCSR